VRSVRDVLLRNPWRWLLVVAGAAITAALIGTWTGAAIMLVAVVVAVVG
jgi:hypothetical protein